MADGGAQYQIDVLAQAVGAEATDAQLTGLANAIDGVAKSATPFDAALASAESRLVSARQATADAAGALQEAEAKFAGLEREAVKAAMAVERGERAAGSLAALQAKADEAAAAVRALSKAGASDELEAAIQQKTSALGRLAKAQKLAAGLDNLRNQATAAAAAVQAESSVVDAARAKANAAAEAEERLAGAYRSIKTAAGQAASAQARASARTDENKAKALQLLSQTSPMLGRYAELAKGLGGYALAGLAAVAAVALLVGATIGLAAAAGAAVVSMVKFAIASDKVAKARLDKIMENARRSFKGLFEGVKTGPMLNAIERLSKLFDKNTATGSALKTLIETLLNPLVRGAELVAPLLGEMFKGAVYGALQLAIVVAKARIALYKLIPKETRQAIKDLVGGTDGLSASFTAGQVVFYAVAGVLGAIAVAALLIGVAIAVAVAATAAFVGGIVALNAAGKAIGAAIVEWAGALKDWVASAATAAKNFITGLVGGLKAGVGSVADAVKGLASSAISAMTGALKTGSPSRLTYQIGGWTAEGYTDALEDSESDVRGAAERMVSPVDRALQSAGSAAPSVSTSTSTSTAAGSVSVSLGGVTIMVHGDGAADVAQKVKAELLTLIDGTLIQMGAGGATS